MNKKQKVMKKGRKKHLMKEKKENVFHERVFFEQQKNGRFFSETTNEIKETKGLFVRKKCLD